MVGIGSIYLLATTVLLVYTLTQQVNKSEGYFAGVLAYLNDPNSVFILDNALVSLAVMAYQACVALFFGETKEGEMVKITDKLKIKIIDIIFFCYIIQLQFSLQVYMVLVLLIFLFVLHSHLVFRSEFLVHVHTTSAAMGLHYRTMALFLILFFVDYQVLKQAGSKMLSITDQSEALFLYYMFSTSVLLLQPFLHFAVDFYQKYTLNHIRRSDQLLATASLLINIPRLSIQLIISLWISYKFSEPIFFIICGIDNLSQIKKSLDSFARIKKLTKTMTLLKRVEGQELDEFHDLTCTVCYDDMKEAVLLPCKHIFHQQCVRQWIIKNLNHFCPKCKQPFEFEKMEAQQAQPALQNFRDYMQQAPQQIPHPNQPHLPHYQPQAFPQQPAFAPNQQFQLPQQQHFQPQNQPIYQPHPQQPLYQPAPQQAAHQQHPVNSDYQHIPSVSSHFSQHNLQRVSVVGGEGGSDRVLREYIVQRPNMSDYPLEVYQAMRRDVLAVGSVGYGAPQMAVSHRTHQHMLKRQEYSNELEIVLRMMSMNRNQQMLFL